MKKKITTVLMCIFCMMFLNSIPAKAAIVTPGKVTLSSIASSAYNKTTITWKKASNATNYMIYYKTPGNEWKKVATVGSDSTSYTHTASSKSPLVVGKDYIYTVRAYNSKSKKYGAYNAIGLKVKTLPNKVILGSAVKNSSASKVTVSWKKASGCNYYVVYRKTTSSMKWKKLAVVKSNVLSYVDVNPAKGQRNIYTVRGYYSGTKVYGGYNATGLSVTIPGAVSKGMFTKILNKYKSDILQFENQRINYMAAKPAKTVAFSDLNKDGKEEMILARANNRHSNIVEIYQYGSNGAELVFNTTLSVLAAGGIRSCLFATSSSDLSFCHYTLTVCDYIGQTLVGYGYQNNKYVKKFTLQKSESLEGDGPTTYSLNGKKISKSEYNTYFNRYTALKTNVLVEDYISSCGAWSSIPVSIAKTFSAAVALNK